MMTYTEGYISVVSSHLSTKETLSHKTAPPGVPKILKREILIDSGNLLYDGISEVLAKELE